MYMWGKIKNTGDDWMYPKPLMDLRFSNLFLNICNACKRSNLLTKCF